VADWFEAPRPESSGAAEAVNEMFMKPDKGDKNGNESKGKKINQEERKPRGVGTAPDADQEFCAG
jgi:hypothetical protein